MGGDWPRHLLALSATAMALDKATAIPPSSVVHGGQYDTSITPCMRLLSQNREPACKCTPKYAISIHNPVVGSLYRAREPSSNRGAKCYAAVLQLNSETLYICTMSHGEKNRWTIFNLTDTRESPGGTGPPRTLGPSEIGEKIISHRKFCNDSE